MINAEGLRVIDWFISFTSDIVASSLSALPMRTSLNMDTTASLVLVCNFFAAINSFCNDRVATVFCEVCSIFFSSLSTLSSSSCCESAVTPASTSKPMLVSIHISSYPTVFEGIEVFVFSQLE